MIPEKYVKVYWPTPCTNGAYAYRNGFSNVHFMNKQSSKREGRPILACANSKVPEALDEIRYNPVGLSLCGTCQDRVSFATLAKAFTKNGKRRPPITHAVVSDAIKRFKDSGGLVKLLAPMNNIFIDYDAKENTADRYNPASPSDGTVWFSSEAPL